jgi:hypothetical protein
MQYLEVPKTMVIDQIMIVRDKEYSTTYTDLYQRLCLILGTPSIETFTDRKLLTQEADRLKCGIFERIIPEHSECTHYHISCNAISVYVGLKAGDVCSIGMAFPSYEREKMLEAVQVCWQFRKYHQDISIGGTENGKLIGIRFRDIA